MLQKERYRASTKFFDHTVRSDLPRRCRDGQVMVGSQQGDTPEHPQISTTIRQQTTCSGYTNIIPRGGVPANQIETSNVDQCNCAMFWDNKPDAVLHRQSIQPSRLTRSDDTTKPWLATRRSRQFKMTLESHKKQYIYIYNRCIYLYMYNVV